jgi:hypothetical protein
MCIYFHFYSASKPAGLAALKQVYEFAVSQEYYPLFVSEFAERGQDYYRATLSRTLDGGWQFGRLRSLRTIRFEGALGWPDLDASPAVGSLRELPQGRYATFLPESNNQIHFRAAPPERPHLCWSNARVTSLSHEGRRLTFTLSGHVAVRAAVAGCPDAVITADGKPVAVTQREGVASIALGGKESGRVVAECR